MGSNKMMGVDAPEIPAIPIAAMQNIQHGLLVEGNNGLSMVLFILLCVGLIQKPKLYLLLAGGFAGLFYILWFIHLGDVRHEGLIFIIFFTVYALADNYDTVLFKKSGILKYAYILQALVILLQLKPAFGFYSNDIQTEYSGSKAAAEYLQEHSLQNKIIVGAQAWAVEALLPYMQDVKQVYYPECERMGTYYIWDSCYLSKSWLYAPDFAVNAAYQRFKEKIQDIVIIVNHRLYYKNEVYLDLLFTNEQTLKGDETFYIYKFKKGVR
ncbi:MAG: hypothetical protein JST70_07250 [Bacteroidetes bacterium]|nr:hypothetical protein [Bacteroidota bacterium]